MICNLAANGEAGLGTSDDAKLREPATPVRLADLETTVGLGVATSKPV